MTDETKAGCLCIGFCFGLLGLVVGAATYLDQGVKERNTPPAATSVAVVDTNHAEATSRYVVETVLTSPELRDTQAPLVVWLTKHPGLRLVQVIPLTGSVGGTVGFIIVSEARTP